MKEDFEKYQGDVFYEVWRSGGNPDAVDYDRVRDCYSDGDEPECCASSELRRQHEAQQRRENERQQEEEYYAQLQQQENDEQS